MKLEFIKIRTSLLPRPHSQERRRCCGRQADMEEATQDTIGPGW